MTTRIARCLSLYGLSALTLCLSAQSQSPSAPSVAQRTAGRGESKTRIASLQSLREGFRNPPQQARLHCYWWWLNGNTDKATITHDLEEMKAKGFGGALLVDANGADQNGNNPVPAGPTFASPQWVELYTHALREADRLGLEITLNITSGWNLGGPDVTPDQASKILTFSRVQIAGGSHIQQQLPAPPTSNNYYRQIAVLAYPLQHGAALAPQPDDRGGDRFTAGPQSETRSAQTLRLRSAAAETGFSMPDSSAMLNDAVSGEDPHFADTPLASVRDISSHVTNEGILDWDAPAGEWEVLSIGYTNSGARVSTSSGAWQGLAIDYLSRAAFEQYWNHTVEPLLAAAKPYRSLKYLTTDSWELGGTNWTPNFSDEFQRRRGYDPVPWLPVVAGRIVGDRSQSTRFLTDLRRTVADLVASEHYDVFAEKAREHSLGVQAESGGPHGAPIDALETFRHSAIPQTEFWAPNSHRPTDPERFFTKEAASAANIYGQHLVAQEGETSMGPQWSESLARDLKPAFDMGITEGMNRLVWHEFTSSPASTGLPGQEYFAGTHLNPKVTWWNAGGAFFDYLNRVQFLMQQGTAVNDVLYFCGDNVPAFVRLKADDPAHVLPGYDYDVTNEDALLHSIHIDGPNLVGPSGVRWRLLAMPRTRRTSVAMLELVSSYVRGGGSVAGLPPLSPTGNVSAEEQSRFSELVKAIWGDCADASPHAYGSGRVYCTSDTHAVLTAMHLPEDLSLQNAALAAASTAGIDYIHRRSGDLDIYFLRNASPKPATIEATFRVSGKGAEIWDAVTGTMHPVNTTATSDGHTTIPLSFAADGSVFVIFSPAFPQTKAHAQPTQTPEPLQLASRWTLQFQPDRGAPTSPITLDTLKSWTDLPDPGVRYFSGTATYRVRVKAPAAAKGAAVYLHLTDVREIAQVRINGTDAGIIWAAPYILRADGLLHSGDNDLEIAVTNLWPNRIIGDHQPGVIKQYTNTNITSYSKDSELLPSGLLGPVGWIVER